MAAQLLDQVDQLVVAPDRRRRVLHQDADPGAGPAARQLADRVAEGRGGEQLGVEMAREDAQRQHRLPGQRERGVAGVGRGVHGMLAGGLAEAVGLAVGEGALFAHARRSSSRPGRGRVMRRWGMPASSNSGPSARKPAAS